MYFRKIFQFLYNYFYKIIFFFRFPFIIYYYPEDSQVDNFINNIIIYNDFLYYWAFDYEPFEYKSIVLSYWFKYWFKYNYVVHFFVRNLYKIIGLFGFGPFGCPKEFKNTIFEYSFKFYLVYNYNYDMDDYLKQFTKIFGFWSILMIIILFYFLYFINFNNSFLNIINLDEWLLLINILLFSNFIFLNQLFFLFFIISFYFFIKFQNNFKFKRFLNSKLFLLYENKTPTSEYCFKFVQPFLPPQGMPLYKKTYNDWFIFDRVMHQWPNYYRYKTDLIKMNQFKKIHHKLTENEFNQYFVQNFNYFTLYPYTTYYSLIFYRNRINYLNNLNLITHSKKMIKFYFYKNKILSLSDILFLNKINFNSNYLWFNFNYLNLFKDNYFLWKGPRKSFFICKNWNFRWYYNGRSLLNLNIGRSRMNPYRNFNLINKIDWYGKGPTFEYDLGIGHNWQNQIRFVDFYNYDDIIVNDDYSSYNY
jgi:hypothetical protein